MTTTQNFATFDEYLSYLTGLNGNLTDVIFGDIPHLAALAPSDRARLFELLAQRGTPDSVVRGIQAEMDRRREKTTNRGDVAEGEKRPLSAPSGHPVLAEKHDIQVVAPPRKDSHTPWPEGLRKTAGALRARLRRNIETAFSILAVVFHIERPNARSLHGLVCRISTRILAYTLCFLMDKYLTQLPAQTRN